MSDINFHNNNKSGSASKAISGLVIVVVVIAGVWGLSKSFSKKTSEVNLKSSASEATQSQTIEQPIKVVIDYGDTQKTETELSVKDGMTAFSVLEQAAKKDNIEVATTKYDFGVMVNSVGAYKGGDDGKYWMYYVNSKVPEVGADQYKVGAGDIVEWKFEKSQ